MLIVALVMGALPASAAFAQEAPAPDTSIERINDTYIDPLYSSICGFPVRTHIVEKVVFTFLPGTTYDVVHVHDQGVEYLTNANVENGPTVIRRQSLNLTFYQPKSLEAIVDLVEAGKPLRTIRGLNYIIVSEPGETVVSSGRYSEKPVEIVFIGPDFIVFTTEETQTPHLEHLSSVVEEEICAPLSQ